MDATKAMALVAEADPRSLVHVIGPMDSYSQEARWITLDPSRSYSVRKSDSPGYSLQIKVRGRWSDLSEENRKLYVEAIFFWGRVILGMTVLCLLFKTGIHIRLE
jgi:hypothetical protein